LRVLPRTHGLAEQLADVVSFGVTGATVKHSCSPLSSAPLTPAACDSAFGSKWAVQQYRPTDVRFAVPDTNWLAADSLLTVLLVTWTPLVLSHPSVETGPHRYQANVPPQTLVPVTVSVAVSVPEETVPVPMLLGEALPPFAVLPACVARVVLHSPSTPRA